MEDYITPEQMMQEEKKAAGRGVTVEMMMENAGKGIAGKVNGLYGPLSGKGIAVIVGRGNNGGDGSTAARYLSQMGARVKVVLLATPDGIKTKEAKLNWDRLSDTQVERVTAPDIDTLYRHADAIRSADMVIAAILGTGVKGTIREPEAEAIRLVNGVKGVKVAVDMPAGLDPATGEAKGPTVRADLTITLHKPKAGLKNNNKYTGVVVVVPIGI